MRRRTPCFGGCGTKSPVYRNEQYDFWALTRFDDVAKILTDRDTFSSAKGGVYQIASADIELPSGLFIFEDPPLHTIHRRLVSRLFTPRAVAPSRTVSASSSKEPPRPWSGETDSTS